MNKKLRIAQIAPISERVPPKKYGGTERVIWELTEELIHRGHDVTLFASGDSKTSAKLVSVFPRGLREAKVQDPFGLNDWSLLHIGNAYNMQEKFDIIHDHNCILSVPIAQFSKTPTVITLHGPINPNNRKLYETFQNPNYITISKAQVRSWPNIKICANVYNGLTMENYPFGKAHKNYLLYVGRIAMDKGTHIAIDIATDLNIPLVIAAKLNPQDQRYFREYVEPRLSEEMITWVGEVDEEKRNKLMSEALCLLHPVTWREPFGLTMIEAMACGCPVVAFNLGSIPEIIINGKTGFVAHDIDEMIIAVTRINEIDRAVCREHALHNFNAKIMTDRYEEVYFKILEGK